MVPLLQHKDSLKHLVERTQALIGQPEQLYKEKSFHPLIAVCSTCNEIAGVAFHKNGNGIKCIPLMLDGYVDEGLQKEIFGECELPYENSEIKIKFHHRSFWSFNDLVELEAIAAFEHDPFEVIRKALIVAKRVLRRSPFALGVVCGPMSTGLHTIEENFQIFNATVFLLGRTMDLFNQLPFEALFHKVHDLIIEDKELCPNRSSSVFFIDYFYRQVFTPNKVWYPHFIHGWEYSIGARAERVLFTELGSTIKDLDENYHLMY